MVACGLKPADKRSFGRAVGSDLAERHGKKRYYTPDQVRASATRLGYPVDWHCWAMCLYTNPVDFRRFHEALGELCDYGAMKAEMVAALSRGASASWFDVDMSWLDWPDLDLSSLFDGLD